MGGYVLHVVDRGGGEGRWLNHFRFDDLAKARFRGMSGWIVTVFLPGRNIHSLILDYTEQMSSPYCPLVRLLPLYPFKVLSMGTLSSSSSTTP